ncbi:uncharacterized protein BHQ10_002095 [Talaromyces amestolkiae]|uniref:Uncharacterized protein n=1 Tax=Talaromyces amestolkiae TaxID=1196081 RepID=A0A364KRB0_TALAM|nr:uncharacterized protein BHQ10_002095 [Talaromyces amestolkiae]RAO66083.1 hypothetical protein BHQ10_002095 [Talaromyces amestolkiae]
MYDTTNMAHTATSVFRTVPSGTDVRISQCPMHARYSTTTTITLTTYHLPPTTNHHTTKDRFQPFSAETVNIERSYHTATFTATFRFHVGFAPHVRPPNTTPHPYSVAKAQAFRPSDICVITTKTLTSTTLAADDNYFKRLISNS